jgi:hypothetical protein
MKQHTENPVMFLSLVGWEVARARTKHPKPINSLHEGYAVILEELDEFWDACRQQSKDRDPRAIRDELIQIAAMCLRTAEDCGLMESNI